MGLFDFFKKKETIKCYVFGCYDYDRVVAMSLFQSEFYSQDSVIKMVRKWQNVPEITEVKYIEPKIWDAPYIEATSDSFACDIDELYSQAEHFLVKTAGFSTENFCSFSRTNIPYPNQGLLLLVYNPLPQIEKYLNSGKTLKLKILLKIFGILCGLTFIVSVTLGIISYNNDKKYNGRKPLPVKVKYVDGDINSNKILPNTVVYFAYWDSENSKLIDTVGNTGNGKIITFKVPFDDEDCTYPFVVLRSKSDLEEVKKNAGSGTTKALRIWPTPRCKDDGFELTLSKDYMSTRSGCSMDKCEF